MHFLGGIGRRHQFLDVRGHVRVSKEELLDLMVDGAYAEIRPVGDDWREVLRPLAETTQAIHHRTP
ncbi:hypothetical protein ABZY05_37885 [Streptomyces canus]|uniref:hypothetical protein n=1 Tax=Streptomyces canus TaxID=58343 RepID=UPI0033B7C322